jgi:hypothetical protein
VRMRMQVAHPNRSEVRQDGAVTAVRAGHTPSAPLYEPCSHRPQQDPPISAVTGLSVAESTRAWLCASSRCT